MNYDNALNLILQKQSLGIKPGLTRIYELLNKMDNPQDKINIIHIAGTNGKGTTAAALSNALIKSGKKVGLFTSPWTEDYREQIKINGNMITEEEFAFYVEKYIDCDATEFELVTAIMYKYFADENVDFAVVECGMGGATNVEKKNISIITSVAIDHTAFLGNTLDEIAAEKSGIIKPDSVCILYPNPKCERIFEKVCSDNNTKLIKINDFGDVLKNDIACAQAALNEIGLDIEAENPNLPARQSKVGNILVDGGHNEDAARALAPKINNEIAVVAMMRDKNVDAYLSLIAPKCKAIYATQVDNARSMSASELALVAKKYCDNVFTIDNAEKAITLAKLNNLSLVCGSFTIESSGSVVIAYLIGEIDHHTAGEVREKIDDTLMFVKPKTLILDFKNVSFMDSSGIGLVMGRYRLLQSINPACQIEIKNVTLQTKKIMELAGLSSIAKIKENENEYKKAN